MPQPPIPLARPNITEREIEAVVAVLRTPNLSLGPKVREFEEAFARQCGTRYAVACSSGTCALHLALLAMGVGPGDEVITSPFSFVASANCILMVGATPVFADIDPHTWNIDSDRVETAVTQRTRAIIPVDVFGTFPDMDRIGELASKHGLRILEDSCEALGARYKGTPAGGLGDAGVFGFYPNKQITTGEGGMVVTDDEEIARLCQSLRNQGRDVMSGWLAHQRMGYNYRLSDLNCALGLAQLARLEEIMSARARVERLYRQRLEGDHRYVLQRVTPDIEPSWFVFVIRLSDESPPQRRDALIEGLRERRIGCSNYFAPIHLQPFYREQFGFAEGSFPVCEAVAARTIALPFHHELSEDDVERVCRTLSELSRVED
jgi:perosamine synthetase